jgi:7-cyano-7-deazaguanine synthase in queuosine biosynthesis
MNSLTPTPLLRVVEEDAASGADRVAILGRDIRTSPERIARYCVTRHEPIYEDLATLVEGMAYWDRLIVRRRAGGWARQLPIQIPVYEHKQFQRPAVIESVADAAWFLTGDRWSFEFVARKGPPPVRQDRLALPQGTVRHVVPFSDGLDSFAQVRLSVAEHGRDAVMLVRAGLGRDQIFPKLVSLRVPRKFSGVRMREVSYRTRPLVFYTLATIAAVAIEADAVVIGENGQGALGPACVPFADEWWLRSAHPAFVQRWASFLQRVLDRPVRFEQPQLWKTKGQVLLSLAERELIAGWELTCSCSSRPKDRCGRHGCGICGGCLLRVVAAHAAGLRSTAKDNACDVYAQGDSVCDQSGRERRMTPGERALAVRAIDGMAELAGLVDSPDGESIVDREAHLIDSSNPGAVRERLRRLLDAHRTEWKAFMCSLPKQSWIRDIVAQL